MTVTRSSCSLASFTVSLLLAGALHAQVVCDTPRETKLSWVNATTRADGSTFNQATELRNTALFMSKDTCDPEALTHEQMVIAQGDASEVCVGEQMVGDWCYAARHEDMAGLLSNVSNIAAKIVTAPNPPAPPTDLRVDPDATTAYYMVETRDILILAPIGTVPAETTCSSTSVIDDNGRLAYKVPVADVQWGGNRRSELVFATCR